MNLTLKQAKGNFFDRDSVMTAIGKARAKVLIRQGAFTRTVMKRLMRRRQGSSPPGQPPNAHSGEIRDYTYFAYDSRSESCVVGPIRLGSSEALDVLERGGFVPMRGVYNRRGQFVPLAFVSAKSRMTISDRHRYVVVKVKIAARPLVKHTAAAVKPKLASFWKDQVRRK